MDKLRELAMQMDEGLGSHVEEFAREMHTEADGAPGSPGADNEEDDEDGGDDDDEPIQTTPFDDNGEDHDEDGTR